MRPSFLLLLVGFAIVLPAVAEEFAIQTVDALGRPVVGVAIDVSCKSSNTSIKVTSDSTGVARGSYDRATCEPFTVTVRQPGFNMFFTGFRDRYVLPRRLDRDEVERILKLDGDDLTSGVREMLANGEEWVRVRIFQAGARLSSALRELTKDPQVTMQARSLLARVGDSDDTEFLINLPAPPLNQAFNEHWRADLAASIVMPESEEQWQFLRRCVLNEYSDFWAAEAAAVTLQVNTSARSRSILLEARQAAERRAAGAPVPLPLNRIEPAIQYIESGHAPYIGAEVGALAERLGLEFGKTVWSASSRNGQPVFNEANDRAIIAMNFSTRIYKATFKRSEGMWVLSGFYLSSYIGPSAK